MFFFIRVVVVMVSLHSNRNPNEDNMQKRFWISNASPSFLLDRDIFMQIMQKERQSLGPTIILYKYIRYNLQLDVCNIIIF